MTTCFVSGQSFDVSSVHMQFYDAISPVFNGIKIPVPPPTLSPAERQRRRLTYRNERKLYRRQCSTTGKVILSPFSEEKPFTLYEPEYWYSDQWNAFQYGRDFDFSRPFFLQFRELMEAVPQLGQSVVGVQNCDYVNQCGWCRDCYLIFEADGNEGCMFGNDLYDSRFCFDSLHVTGSELCYECIDCRQCYACKWSQECINCSDSYLLKACIGCKNCVGCINLRNQQFCIFNKKYSEQEYKQKLAELKLHTRSGFLTCNQQFEAFVLQHPHKALHGFQNEDSTGDYLYSTQRCHLCFDVQNAQDCFNVTKMRNCKQVHDSVSFGAEGGAEFCYECHEVGGGVKNLLFCDQVWDGCHDLLYCKLCLQKTHHCFGCVGLKHAEYCILNKQYSKEEYETLVPRIIDHMKNAGEWGQFFPSSISPFCYNETLAQDFFPLQSEQAQVAGFRWRSRQEELPNVDRVIDTEQLPETIESVPDDILNWAVRCSVNQQPFRITKKELDFYRTQKLPIPAKHPDTRHNYRMSMRNPQQIYRRQCAKTGQEIWTTFSPERPEIVYSEKAYREAVS